ncbi:MAG: LysM peptidoglycan-binding domain-containing protein [Spirochaetota bacterium]
MATKRLCSAVILILVLASSATMADEQVHVLARGETIYTLARTYDLAADVILDYNDIADPTRLAVGTRIRIPGTYVVREGEYVYSIANKLEVDWLALLDANGLGRDDVVRPGDVLLVPREASSRAVSPSAPDADEPVTGTIASEPSVRGTASEAVPATTVVGEWPHPGERGEWNGKFPGVVMNGSEGDEFRSVTDGVIEFVGPFSSFGKLILVRSANGYLYGYAGADRALVREGERVAAGTVLGTVGFSPAFESAKVLFTVWKNNRYVDPQTAPRG